MDSHDGVQVSGIPPELVAVAKNITLNLLSNSYNKRSIWQYVQ